MKTLIQHFDPIWTREIENGRIGGNLPGAGARWGIDIDKESRCPRFFEERNGARTTTTIKRRELGRTAIMYNPLRQLRPGGQMPSLGKQPDVAPEVWQCRYGCNNPAIPFSLLTREPLVGYSAPTYTWSFFANLVPLFADGHMIIVRSIQRGTTVTLPHTPQSLTRETIIDFLAIGAAVVDGMLFFNSLHAGATVAHLHFQLVNGVHGVELERASRARRGAFTVLSDYPAFCVVFDSHESSFLSMCVSKLQTAGVPYNLLAIGGSAFLFPRRIDHEVIPEFPTGVLASVEMAGVLVTGQLDVFENATEADALNALAKVTLTFQEFESVVR